METKFYEALNKEINSSFINNNPYSKRNFLDKTKNFIKKNILGYKIIGKNEALHPLNKSIEILSQYGERMATVYDDLQDEYSKLWYIKLIAARIIGYEKVIFPLDYDKYHRDNIENEKLKLDEKKFDTGFGIILNHLKLHPIGVDLECYLSTETINILFQLEQYNYQNIVQVEEGDTVLDCGACWGDTALYFSNKVGQKGKVYAFEFIPSNIELFEKNIRLNVDKTSNVALVPNPVSNVSDEIFYYRDLGPGSYINSSEFKDFDGKCSSITIDDWVERNNIEKIDFIKMDIEGAEPFALEGARNTLVKFKPKLAICIYHSLDDFVNIPIWIDQLKLNYRLFTKHSTLGNHETVIFAISDDTSN
jgi:FkbM family methyltransferase